MVTLDEFFAGWPDSRRVFDAVARAVRAAGGAREVVTKSQIAFSAPKAFAWVWVPDRYLRGGHAPLVLSVAFPEPDPSLRWKQVVEPSPGRWMHHLELFAPEDVDAEVGEWVRRARESSGAGG